MTLVEGVGTGPQYGVVGTEAVGDGDVEQDAKCVDIEADFLDLAAEVVHVGFTCTDQRSVKPGRCEGYPLARTR